MNDFVTKKRYNTDTFAKYTDTILNTEKEKKGSDSFPIRYRYDT